MNVLRLLYGKLDTFPHNEHWLEQKYVALLRLMTSPPWKHLECLGFLGDIASILEKILPNSLSTAASNASLIVSWPEIMDKFLFTDIAADFVEAHEVVVSERRFPRGSGMESLRPTRPVPTCYSSKPSEYTEVMS